MGYIKVARKDLPIALPFVKNISADVSYEFEISRQEAVIEMTIQNTGATNITVYLNNDLENGLTIESGVTFIFENIQIFKYKLVGVTKAEILEMRIKLTPDIYDP